MLRIGLAGVILFCAMQTPAPDPAQLAATAATRLQQQYEKDPAAALPIVRELATLGAPPEGTSRDAERGNPSRLRARQIFVAWIHHQLALDYVPATAARAKTPAHAAFLGALAQGRDRDDVVAVATEALRMWVDAQQTTDAARLRALAAGNFPDPSSYGGRYQLLLADYLERQPGLERDGRALRDRLVDMLSRQLENREEAPLAHLRYWLAYGLSRQIEQQRAEMAAAKAGPRQFELLTRIARTLQTAGALTLASGAVVGAVDRDPARLAHPARLDVEDDEDAWFREQAALGGPTEFVTRWVADLEARAAQLEARGDRDGARMQRARLWGPRLALARSDPPRLAALEAEWSAANPGASFNAAFAEMVIDVGRSRRLPPPTFAGFVGMWRLLYVWSTTCAPCASEFETVNALVREFPDAVVALVATGIPAAAVRQYAAAHRLLFQTMIAPAGVADEIGAYALPARFIVSPEARYARLPSATWQSDARRILSLNR